MPRVIVAHPDHELLFKPKQQVPEGEAARVQCVDETRKQRTRWRGRVTNRAFECPLARQRKRARKQRVDLRRLVVCDGLLDTVSAISAVQVLVLRGVVDTI